MAVVFAPASALSGMTNGIISIPDYTLDLGAIATSVNMLTAQMVILNKMLATNWTLEGAAIIPASPYNIMQGQAMSLNNMATMTASIMTTQSEIAANLSKLSVSINNLSAHAATSVTTQQVMLTETIKNNQYVQQTTEDALQRSGLPATEVPPQRLQTQITSTINDVTKVNSGIQAASLVQTGIANAATFTTGIVTNVIAESYVGTAAASAWTGVKGWLGMVKPEEMAKKAIAESSNKVAAAQIGRT